MAISFSGPPDNQLSPHFTLAEMTKTDTGLPNIPTPDALANLKNLAIVLERLRDSIGPMTVISGYRSQNVQDKLISSGNAQAAAHSFHSLGMAADIVPLNMTAEKAMAIIASTPTLKESFGEIALKKNALHLSLPGLGKQGVLMEVVNNQYLRLSIDKIKALIDRNKVVVAAAGSGLLLAILGLGAFFFIRSRNRK